MALEPYLKMNFLVFIIYVTCKCLIYMPSKILQAFKLITNRDRYPHIFTLNEIK